MAARVDCDSGRFAHQGAPDALPEMLGTNIEILDVQAVPAAPGGVDEEIQNHTHHIAVQLSEQALKPRLRAKPVFDKVDGIGTKLIYAILNDGGFPKHLINNEYILPLRTANGDIWVCGTHSFE
jgi:hypothetical protein